MPEGKVAASAQRPPREAEQSGQTVDEQRRARNIRRLLWFLAVVSVGAIIFDVAFFALGWFSAGTNTWQLLVAAGFTALALALIPVAFRLTRAGNLDAAGNLILLGITLVLAGSELVLAGGTLYLASAGTLILILAGYVSLSRRVSAWLAAVVVFLLAVLLINLFEPLPRYPIGESPAINVFVPAISLLIVVAVAWLAVRALRIGVIRTRLLVAFVALTLLATTTGVVSAVMGYRSGQEQVIAQLESVATLKEAEIDTWVDALQAELSAMLAGQYTVVLLQEESLDPADYQEAHDKLQGRFQRSLNWLEETFMMDLKGYVVLSSDATQEGKIHAGEAYFQRGLEDFYVHPPFYSPSLGRTSVLVTQPVLDQRGQMVGVLAGRASMDNLSKLMLERAGLGQTGETYLISANHDMLTESRSGEEGIYVRTEGANAAIGNHAGGSGLYDGYWDEPVVGVYHWLPELQMALLAEQGQAEAFSSLYTMLAVNAGVVLVAVLLAVAGSLFVTRSIATPLADLAETATQIAAGDLERVAQVEREDEIGAVAQAFNSMTAQLRGLIGGLEQRIADRTQELEQRSRYLEAAAEVGSAATSILDANQLIRQVVELIRDRFDLYYVGLFLLDPAGEWAVLRAGTGAAGRAMLDRGHRIQVGEGMIGWSVAHAEARVALEAGEDAVRLATAEVPETRSEAAIPLNSRGQTLGALTVQSATPGVFDPDIITVLQTAADQVAVALDNARLFTEREVAMEAQRRAYGEFARQAWTQALQDQSKEGFRSDARGISPAGDVWRSEMERAMQTGQSVQDQQSDNGDTKHVLAVPIKIRDKVVAMLDTYKPAGAGEWTEEEVTFVESIADQLGVALENARLYEDTHVRAERERVVSDIAAQVRAAGDVDGILRTAVREIRRALGVTHGAIRLGTEARLRPPDDNSVSFQKVGATEGVGE